MFTNATAVSAAAILLEWQDNADTETGYVLYRSDSGNSGPYTQVASLASDATSYTDAVIPESTFYYRLSVTNEVNGSATDPASCQTNATTPVAPPVSFFEDF